MATIIKLSKLDKAEFIMENVSDRFLQMREFIGPTGTIPMSLFDTQHSEHAVEIAVLFDELQTGVNDLMAEIKRENHHEDV